MRSRLINFIIRKLLRSSAHGRTSRFTIDEVKRLIAMRHLLRRLLLDSFLILIGVLSAGFGLKGFLLPNGFIDGGAVGISLLVAKVSGMPLSILLILVNAPFLIMGLRMLGREFTIKAILAIIGLSLAVAFIPYPEITRDKLLIAIFGGFFLGAGIGLSVRGGAVIDGTEVLAISMSRRLGISIGDIILIINIIVFSFAAWLINIETALYAMLTYLSASKTVDFLLEGIEEYTGVTIVSPRAKEISDMIAHDLNHGVTVYKGERGFGKRGDKQDDVKIIFTVLTRLEINRLKAEVNRIDADAFMVMHSIRDTIGGMTKKRRFKH